MPRITIDDIIDVTLRQGLDVATTTTVARELGVTQPALYKHVASKADLLDQAAGRATSDLDAWQAVGSWDASAHAFADALWEQLERGPGLAVHLLSTAVLPVALQSAAARLVVAAGEHRVRVAILAVDAIVHLVCLTHVGSRRLGEDDTAWVERSSLVAAPLYDAVVSVRATEPRLLAHEQIALLISAVENRGVENSAVENSGVENGAVENSGVDSSGVDGAAG